MKYRGVVRLTGAAEKALSLSKNVRKIQETLVNPQETRFISVTIPERMGLWELERLVKVLEKADLSCITYHRQHGSAPDGLCVLRP